MLRHVLPLAGIMMLIGAAPTAAHTTITCDPCSFPYQQWVDEAKVPTPDVMLAVVEIPCPLPSAGVYAPACTERGTYTIWDAEWIQPRRTFLHELGHNFDYYMATDWIREKFSTLVEDYRPWNMGPNAPKEKFAEAYKWCALRNRIKRSPNEAGAEYHPTPPLHAKVCHLIKTIPD